MKRDHLVTLVFRLSVFITALLLVVFYPEGLVGISNTKILFFRVYHLIWFAAVVKMVLALFPNFSNTKLPLFKSSYSYNDVEIPSKRMKLKRYTQEMNRNALKTMLYFLIVLSVIWVLFYLKVINILWIVVFSAFFYFMDIFCIVVWCPFRRILIKNKCCRSCRIHNWGYFGVFGVLFLVPSFWTYSLAILSVLILVQWEFIHYRHPERFSEIYNANLMCKNCPDPCRIKK